MFYVTINTTVKLMGKHYNKKSNGILKILEKDGFTCEPLGKNRNKFWIYKEDGQKLLVHSGEKSYHPLRRFLKKTYNYEFII